MIGKKRAHPHSEEDDFKYRKIVRQRLDEVKRLNDESLVKNSQMLNKLRMQVKAIEVLQVAVGPDAASNQEDAIMQAAEQFD